MISTGDVKKGVIIELDGQLMKVLDWSHIKMARGSAQVRMKLQNVRRGDIVERTFQAGTRWPRARVEQRKAQYLYGDGDAYHFMDTETYEQSAVGAALIGDDAKFLLENTEVMLSSHDGEVLGVELPVTVDLRVAQTDPGFAGDTATGAKKAATLETGHRRAGAAVRVRGRRPAHRHAQRRIRHPGPIGPPMPEQRSLWDQPPPEPGPEAAPVRATPRILRVTDLNRRVRSLLDADAVLADVWVEGEVSQPSFPASGHCFFTLKDSSSQVRAALFRDQLVARRHSARPRHAGDHPWPRPRLRAAGRLPAVRRLDHRRRRRRPPRPIRGAAGEAGGRGALRRAAQAARSRAGRAGSAS